MGQSKSTTLIEVLDEDLIRVQSVQQDLRSHIHSMKRVKDGTLSGHTEFTIRTMDRDGNMWESTTRYSIVVQLLKTLKEKRA